jgi:hypothetical protein
MKDVIHNTQGGPVQRGSFSQLQEVAELENASANLQAHLDDTTGVQVTVVMSTLQEGHAWSKERYSCQMVSVAAMKIFHITMQTQDCAMKLVRGIFVYVCNSRSYIFDKNFGNDL